MTTMTHPPASTEYSVHLRRPHEKQAAFLDSPAPRIIVRAGRRGGKTTGSATRAVKAFLAGRRVLYAVPTQDQVEAFWFETKRALSEPLDAGVFYKNESSHVIELLGTKQRIRAKTAWNADTLRGDYADLLILDEWQLMDEDAWEVVGAPMLLDNNGDALFIYTPPSLRSRSVSKARDPLHAAKMFKTASLDTSGRWAAFHFGSAANPHISGEALAEIARDMTALSYRQEIEAEDILEVPGALWTVALLERQRVIKAPEMVRVVIGVDPPGGVVECGIVGAGMGRDGHVYVLADRSLQASPERWAEAVLSLYEELHADRVLGEKNFGGDMVRSTLQQVARVRGVALSYKDVTASRGKAVRAEPVVAMYEKGRVHHVGAFPLLEQEMTFWVPGGGGDSPNRMDALVWALTELISHGSFTWGFD